MRRRGGRAQGGRGFLFLNADLSSIGGFTKVYFMQDPSQSCNLPGPGLPGPGLPGPGLRGHGLPGPGWSLWQRDATAVADALGYTSINICGLINHLGNIHDQQNASQATNDGITTTTVWMKLETRQL